MQWQRRSIWIGSKSIGIWRDTKISREPSRNSCSEKRIEVRHTARNEMSKRITRIGLQTAARTNMPASADNPICLGDNVLV